VQDDRFEWDDIKAATNARKHGVTFEDAKAVYDDPRAITELDDTVGEERETTIGMSAQRILFVVSTERGSRLRIISARRATRYEEDLYYRYTPPRR
jgi:uncharacterized protein